MNDKKFQNERNDFHEKERFLVLYHSFTFFSFERWYD